MFALSILAVGPMVAQYTFQSAFPNLPTFSNPTELVHAGDGMNRLFLVQQRGIIYVFQNSPTVSTRKIFLDLSDRVSPSGSESGLPPHLLRGETETLTSN